MKSYYKLKDLSDILSLCRSKGIRILPDESGGVKLQGNVSLLSGEELREIRSFKQQLIRLLDKSGLQHNCILPAPALECYPLSSAQQRMWMLDRLSTGESAWHITMTLVIEGDLNMDYLTAAFQVLIERHHILRTVFKTDEAGTIWQYVQHDRNPDFHIQYLDLYGHDKPSVDSLLRDAHQQSFDLERGPLLRASLYRTADHKWIFDLVIHHIICDGWSMDILIQELMNCYSALCRNETSHGAPLSIQYHDYAYWQQQESTREKWKALRNYWLKQFEGEIPVLQLPGDLPRPAVKTSNGAAVKMIFPPALTTGLKMLLRQEECTLFTGLVTIVHILLHRYTSQEHIIIGFPVAGRDIPGLEDQVGLYMNTVALNLACNGNESFNDLLSRNKNAILHAQDYQAYPFDQLVEELNLQRDLGRNALFDVMITLKEHTPSFMQQQDGINISVYDTGHHRRSKFDLSFNFIDGGDAISLEIIYNTDIYLDASIVRTGEHLSHMLAAMINHPMLPVIELEYMSGEEIHELLFDFGNQSFTFPEDKTVTGLFMEQVMRVPDAAALVYGEERICYSELHDRSNRLAALLLAHYNIQPNDLIAIMLDRSIESIVAILAIWKAGAAYVPIDPDFPATRIEYILQDTRARVVLTTSYYKKYLLAYAGAVIDMHQKMEYPHITGNWNGVSIRQDDLAYVIYTSGTTGQPKGTMISHRSLIDYFFGLLAATNIGECRHFGMVSTIAADLGNTVIFAALLTGGVLHIYSMAALMDPDRIFDGQLDCIKIVPSHWRSLQSQDRIYLPAKCLIFGGEPLTPEVLEMIRNASPACEVYNHYGPSETTIGKLINHIDLNNIPDPVPLGSPFCQSSILILDHRHQLLPVNKIGEICISGAGLAQGYLNQAALTAEKFVDHPFIAGEKMYKTGDLGRWLWNGKIVFEGRKDEQVKIRGYRIELKEIETVLRTSPYVKDAIVHVIDQDGDKSLAAYIVKKDGLDTGRLKAWLGSRLPAYMIPVHYILLDKIPLTLNGKIDKKSLPIPAGIARSAMHPYIAPVTDIEKKLAGMWQELLGEKDIGTRDNFFDAGGHSLKMMQLLTRINKTFSIHINIINIFKDPTIENIAEQITFILDQQHQKANRANLKQVEI
ncbi:amino acid adenylation domain-containing protein [Chitinophaga sp.]|uniref:non-ribosomal peptide synthetase n=1 Tax=Chitinophaga sp. TaxID=1869181 RepID=UPI0031CECC37